MRPTRRQFLAGTVSTFSVLGTARLLSAAPAGSRSTVPKIGMCDWSLGQMNPSAMSLARQIGLDGVEVSVGTRENNMWLRREEVQAEYLQAARDQGMAIPSLALGELNHVPLMSEPRAALWVADAIEVARRMKVNKMLLAFFGKGEL
ncbi:MAG TPA: sugar phosphate isomerase/epimerase, partial [Phycisphaerae bacterium]|nr:sugar phosphate isomerase/epimerase [Phycisphaerae bacterium]